MCKGCESYTINEEPSEMSKGTLFLQDEPRWKAVDPEATKACPLRADDGKDSVSVGRGLGHTIPHWGHAATDETDTLLLQLMQDTLPAVATITGKE